ncbi:MAG: 3-isopropylmalate dehydrogenase [Actinomycetota bacterium]
MTDEVTLGCVIGVTVVDDRDDRAQSDLALRCRCDDLCVFEDRFDLANATFHVALLVLGRVVVAVFLQISEQSRGLDLLSDLDSTTGREVCELGGQPVVCSLRKLVFRHAHKGYRRPYDGISMSRAHRVAVIGGDGIGPEVVTEALKVVAASGVKIDTTDFDLGGARYLRDGEILSDSTLDQLRGFDAILLGAVGTPDVPPGVIERGLLLKMRFELDLYINQRPFSGVAPGHTAPHDFVVIRENTEGPYVGEGGVLRKGTPFEVATQGSVNTAHGVERCVRYAFELAAKRSRKHLTLVHKTNVLTFAGDLWQRTFTAVAKDFPQVATAYNHVDAACIYFVQDPHRYDVIVTDNLFGDILTDLGGAVSGGIGVASSANLNPRRTGPSMFEPVHGSAPDIVGTGKANPVAAILSAAHMLEFLGEARAAEALRTACVDAPSGTTSQVGTEIASRVAKAGK